MLRRLEAVNALGEDDVTRTTMRIEYSKEGRMVKCAVRNSSLLFKTIKRSKFLSKRKKFFASHKKVRYQVEKSYPMYRKGLFYITTILSSITIQQKNDFLSYVVLAT